MPKIQDWPPPIKIKKGYARVSYRGVWYHLGPAKSEAAEKAWLRLIGQWRVDPNHKPKARQLLIGELADDFLAAAPFVPSQKGLYKRILNLLTQNHSAVSVDDFKPLAVKGWLAELGTRLVGIDGRKRKDGGLFYSRTYLDMVLQKIKLVWQWGVESERVPVDRYQELLTVKPLRPDQARPGKEVMPAPDVDVSAVLWSLPQSVAAMVMVQRHSAARPSELFGLRPCDLDRSRDVWTFTPKKHKTSGKGKIRVLTFGPKAQAIFHANWPASETDLFFPVRLRVYPPRIVPVYGSETTRRAAEKAKRKPKPIGQAYKAGSYRNAILRAGERLNRPRWKPYQLRHARLTEIRDAYGSEQSAAVGGHSIKVNEIYTQQRVALAADVAAATG